MASNLKEPSLRKRYTSKVAASVVSIPLQLIINSLAPRILGPAAFGTYTFVTDFFVGFANFLDSGTSTYFYKRISQNPKDVLFVRFYVFVIIVTVFTAAFLVLTFIGSGLAPRVWPNTPLVYVWYGLVFGLVTWVGQVLSKGVDAYGLTLIGERIRTAHRALLAVCLSCLFLAGRQNIHVFFFCHLLLLFVLCVSLIHILRRKALSGLNGGGLIWRNCMVMTSEMWRYSCPLLTYGAASLLGLIMDRWILQQYFGSQEQGYFGLAFRLSAVCILFTSALTPLLLREFAQAYSRNEFCKVRRDYKKYVPVFFVISCYFSLFAATHADTVTRAFGGDQFVDAILPVAIMCLYPIHQTYGQLSSTLFFAAGNTKLYRNIGVAGVFVGVVFSWWLVRPSGFGGLQMGASGVAIKMVVLQVVLVNAQLWCNARQLKLSYRWILMQQIFVVLLFGGLSVAIRISIEPVGVNAVVKFVVCGFSYSICCLALIIGLPELVGQKRRAVLDLCKYLVGLCIRSVRLLLR